MSEAPDQGISVAGRTITAALLLGLAVLFGWLSAGGNQPSQGTFLENCRTETQPNQRAEQSDRNPYNSFIPIERDKSVPNNQPTANEDEKTKNDRRLTEYTCQLAVLHGTVGQLYALAVRCDHWPCGCWDLAGRQHRKKR
jgi:hypothetical protein